MRWVVSCGLLAAITLTVGCGGGATGSGSADISQYVTAEDSGVVVVNGTQLLAWAPLQSDEAKKLIADQEGGAGVRADQVEKLIFVIGADSEPSRLVLMLKDGVDTESLKSKMLSGEPETVKADGRTYYRKGSQELLIEKNLAIMSDGEGSIEKMLKSQAKDTTLLKQLAATSMDADIVAVIDAAAQKDQIAKQAEAADQMVKGTKEAVDKVTAIVAKISTSAPDFVQLDLVAGSSEEAANITKTLTDAIEQGKKAYAEQKTQALMLASMFAPGIDKIADGIVNGLSVKANGNSATVSIKKPENLDEFVLNLIKKSAAASEPAPEDEKK